MEDKVAVVVTSIAKPNGPLRQLASGCRQKGYDFIVIGDEASPDTFELDGCRFFGLKEQRELGLKFAELCPTRHYARKNIGYLVAMQSGAGLIVETDDDNLPYDEFWGPRTRHQTVRTVEVGGWVNIYRYFTDSQIWPRGLPLDQVNNPVPAFEDLATKDLDSPIQQGLSDTDPDVDAIYRLILPLPLSFRRDRRLALQSGTWSPFNSQNTTWWREAFPLLYLPAYCSFRMTDIWRSFVAQRIAWANGWSILFHEPTGEQERNDHNLMRDFQDELPGYLNNSKICEAFSQLQLPSGAAHLSDNVRSCYEQLVRMDLIDSRELTLIDAWIADLGMRA
ncbi:MAG TPA: STELLO glycosyltransferase family protein [Pyrinomonadaceae bacterium]|nr:STELLO glycosyltransferase family protein [Pyrinomonadaceae bacterium]